MNARGQGKLLAAAGARGAVRELFPAWPLIGMAGPRCDEHQACVRVSTGHRCIYPSSQQLNRTTNLTFSGLKHVKGSTSKGGAVTSDRLAVLQHLLRR